MKIEVSASDILLTLGYTDTSANEFILEQAELAALKANSISGCRKVFRKIKIESIKGDKVMLETGDCFICKSLALGIKGCSHLIVALTTLGSAMDEEISRAFKSQDPLMGMMLRRALKWYRIIPIRYGASLQRPRRQMSAPRTGIPPDRGILI
jgi:hypothetical protein